MHETNFGAIDWTIVLLYVLASGIIGFLCRKYIKDMADFVVAGRRLNLFIAVATFSSTEMGLVTVMYFAEEGYTNGFSAFTMGVIFCLVMVTIGLTGFIIKPLRASRVMTIAELYELRYNRKVRFLGGVVIATAGILNMGVFLKYGAVFLSKVTGLPEVVQLNLPLSGEPLQVPALNLTMTVLLVVVLLYTMLGGMFSVVLTDFVQFVVTAVGLALGTYFVLHEVGLGRMFEAAVRYRGVESLSPFTCPNYGWQSVLWWILLWISASTLWQAGTMRISAVRDSNLACRVFFVTGLTHAARAIIPMLFGIAALAYLGTSFDVIVGGEKHQPWAMPTLLAQIIPTGAIGIMVAGMLAAFMSTHDSYLLAWSSVITQDVISPLFGHRLSTRSRILITRIIILALGLFLLIYGLWHKLSSTVWEYLALTGTMYLSGALALVVGGLYWKRANEGGAYAAIVLGVITPLVQLFFREFFSEYFKIDLTPAVAGGISYLAAALGMVFGSLLTQRIYPSKTMPVVEGKEGVR